jgi:hypothetical protein
MPFGEMDCTTIAEKAELEASRAPNPALQYLCNSLPPNTGRWPICKVAAGPEKLAALERTTRDRFEKSI